jgi:HPt (histidine-containing phosphotransfer) domain-containing protein
LAAADSLGNPAAPVDRGHLERLATRFGAHFVIQLIDIFIAQGRERLTAAEQGIADGDVTAVVAAAHALKSSAGNLGAKPLGECAAEIERRGTAGAAVPVLAPLVTTLNAAFAKACDALETLRRDVERRTV